MFPNDYFSLHRVISLGQSLTSESDLGRTIEKYSADLVKVLRRDVPRPSAVMEAQPAL